jgi:hypothetical protein
MVDSLLNTHKTFGSNLSTVKGENNNNRKQNLLAPNFIILKNFDLYIK